MTTKELRQLISAHFLGHDWARLGFTFLMVAHAAKNIPRECLRKMGAPEGEGSKQNWADILSGLIAAIPLLFLLLMIFSSPVSADQAFVQWEAPTERTDGTPLSVDEIGNYDVFVDGVLSTTVPGTATSATLDLATGRHCVTLQTVDTGSRRSVDSEAVCREAEPNSPRIISITVIVP